MFSAKKDIEKLYITTVRQIQRGQKKKELIDNSTYLRITLKIQVIYLDFGT